MAHTRACRVGTPLKKDSQVIDSTFSASFKIPCEACLMLTRACRVGTRLKKDSQVIDSTFSASFMIPCEACLMMTRAGQSRVETAPAGVAPSRRAGPRVRQPHLQVEGSLGPTVAAPRR